MLLNLECAGSKLSNKIVKNEKMLLNLECAGARIAINEREKVVAVVSGNFGYETGLL